MAIEISGLSGSPVNSAGDNGQVSQRDNPPPTADATSASSASKSDQFSLTDSATRLRELEREVAAFPTVDPNRVEQTQRAIATGSFQVDPSSVAEKMLALEKGLP